VGGKETSADKGEYRPTPFGYRLGKWLLVRVKLLGCVFLPYAGPRVIWLWWSPWKRNAQDCSASNLWKIYWPTSFYQKEHQ